ncbi:hypothetical protein BT63DRAFT_416309 [Microthyrium microscopicum]|uniref:Elongator complex protein 5 n=1 Tax=Microthyrium microscopicum TaxID=703497 RepID=A0A6A6U416_9PEZI|nr:hypothetical protein BT63DRAFT_416309 [Microthyrium microscopicum]
MAFAKFPAELQSLIADLPDGSSHLLLETAGTSTSWLAIRYVAAVLKQASPVIIVTWLRSSNFWRQELRKAANIDSDELSKSNKLAIHDDPSLTSAEGLSKWAKELTTLLSSDQQYQNAVLVLDSPDIVLGTVSISADSLLAIVIGLRAVVRSTIILTASDLFSLEANSQTPLRTQQQQFLMTLGHQANLVLSTRVLDTGHAKDVSGVLMISHGGQAAERQTGSDSEYLYQVENNRATSVWKRGADR